MIYPNQAPDTKITAHHLSRPPFKDDKDREAINRNESAENGSMKPVKRSKHIDSGVPSTNQKFQLATTVETSRRRSETRSLYVAPKKGIANMNSTKLRLRSQNLDQENSVNRTRIAGTSPLSTRVFCSSKFSNAGMSSNEQNDSNASKSSLKALLHKRLANGHKTFGENKIATGESRSSKNERGSRNAQRKVVGEGRDPVFEKAMMEKNAKAYEAFFGN